MAEKDPHDTLCNLLYKLDHMAKLLERLDSAIEKLAAVQKVPDAAPQLLERLVLAIEALPKIHKEAQEVPPVIAPPAVEKWSEKASRFISSPEAADMANKHSLTIEAIAAVCGLNLETATSGHKKHMGRLLFLAGYRRVSGPNHQHDYRKLS